MVHKEHDRDTIGTETYLPEFAKPSVSAFIGAQENGFGYQKYKIRCRRMPNNNKKYEFWVDVYTRSGLLIRTKFCMVDFGVITHFITVETAKLREEVEAYA